MSDLESPRLLAYTIAFDQEGSTLFRAMGKLLVSSLLRTGFGGDIMIFHNHALPFFPTGRSGVTEHFVDPASVCARISEAGCRFKYEAREWIDASRYDHILYLDSDCLAFRNIDHLLIDPEHEVTYLEEYDTLPRVQFQGHFGDEELARPEIGERRGSNAGIWRVRADVYESVCAEMLALYDVPPVKRRFWGDQAQWNRLLIDRGEACAHFPFEEAMINTGHFDNWTRALVHFPGMNYKERLSLMFGAFAYRFYGDGAPVLVDLMES